MTTQSEQRKWEYDCEYCQKNAETRPYGRNGERICFECATSPENEATSKRMFAQSLDAAGQVAVLDHENEIGPRPATEFIKHKAH